MIASEARRGIMSGAAFLAALGAEQAGRAHNPSLQSAPASVDCREGSRTEPRRLSVGECISSELDSSDRTSPAGSEVFEDYVVRLSAGDAVEIELDSVNRDGRAFTSPEDMLTNGGFDTILDLRRAGSGEPLMSNDDRPGSLNSQIVFTPPEDGEYVIRAGALGAGIGRYVLRVHAADPSALPTLASESRINGLLRPESRGHDVGAEVRSETFSVDAQAGQRLQFRLTNSSQPPLDMRILDSLGRIVGMASWGQGAPVIVAQEATDYTVEVSGPTPSAALPFEVQVLRGRGAPARAPRPVAAGSRIEDALTLSSPVGAEPGGTEDPTFFYNLYQLRVSRGRPLTITVNSVGDSIDPVLEVGEETILGFAVAGMDDDGGGDLNSRLVIVPRANGRVLVRVRSLDWGLGSYVLGIEEGDRSPPAPPTAR